MVVGEAMGVEKHSDNIPAALLLELLLLFQQHTGHDIRMLGMYNSFLELGKTYSTPYRVSTT
jgi:hypothetical protein